ncbi:MAG TPA: FAD-binding oxidoreductase [Gaiellaceae bacterium]|nr:FAD-binding oxidoreductase [Gaiellaceae bacterium]
MAVVSEPSLELHGEVIEPDDPGYDEARKVYNGMIDKRPAAIARCADQGDVIQAIRYGRERGLDIAIRGGGHNGGGLGTVDDGLVIDLSGIRGVHVDPKTATVRVAGGSLLRDVDHATAAFGLAVPAGIIGTTGAGGLTLGGGIGHLTRRSGLTIDNLLSADVVLADGSVVTASEDEHPDLFWALRGGGGNFGVVTSFTFRGHPVDTVVAGPMLWSLDRSAEILRAYREFIPSAPRELNGFFAFLTVPPAPPFPEELHLQKMCGVIWCYSGPASEADAALAPARDWAPVALDGVQPMPLPMLQGAFDGLYPPGDQWYWRADFVTEIPDEAVERNVEFGEKLPTWKSTMHLYPIDGAVHDVGESDTAWAYRNARWSQVMVGVDPDPANAEALRTWAVDYWEALHPYSAGGAYVNFMMDEGQDRVKATYGKNYDRLVQVKKTYDPDNVFHVNQNIVPA